MTHVCFVDDDTLLLAGVRRVMRRASPSSTFTFANSGAEALAVLNAQTVDVLVTDLHMPVMGGHTLLAHVQEQFPQVARIVATGDIDPASAFDLQLVAHRLVSKPFETGTLAALFRELHDCTQLSCSLLPRTTACRIRWEQLAAQQLAEQQPTCITTAVARDNPWLAVLLLQASNGGFTHSSTCLDVEAAVISLGPAYLAIMLKRLVALAADNSCSSDRSDPPRFVKAALRLLLMRARTIAEQMAPRGSNAASLYPGISPELAAAQFVSTVQSATLLRAASPTHAISAAATPSTAATESTVSLPNKQSELDATVHTVSEAAQRGVPSCVVNSVLASLCHWPRADAASRAAGGALRLIFAGHGSSSAHPELVS